MWSIFNILSGSEGDLCDQNNSKEVKDDGATIAADPKCLQCKEISHSYVCADCIRKGDFKFSTQSKISGDETFTEKKQALYKLREELRECNETYNQRIKDMIAYENLQHEVTEKQKRLEILEKLIEEKRLNVKKLSDERKKLREENADKRISLETVAVKAMNCEQYLSQKHQEDPKLLKKYSEVQENLKKSTRSTIEDLIKYIFPIEYVRSENDGSDEETTEQDDRLEFYGIDEVQYRIVGPSLPANGEYAGDFDMLEYMSDDMPAGSFNDKLTSRNTKYRTLGALTYTTQLVQLLYYYLGVRMPQKLTYDAFCKDITKEKMLKLVKKLNMSVMYLAYTQNAKLYKMQEDYTLENILIVLDTKRSDLGRFGFHAVGNAPLVKSVDPILIDIDSIFLSNSDSDSEVQSDSDISFCMDLTELTDMEEENVEPSFVVEEKSTLTQSIISAAASQITSIFGWVK